MHGNHRSTRGIRGKRAANTGDTTPVRKRKRRARRPDDAATPAPIEGSGTEAEGEQADRARTRRELEEKTGTPG